MRHQVIACASLAAKDNMGRTPTLLWPVSDLTHTKKVTGGQVYHILRVLRCNVEQAVLTFSSVCVCVCVSGTSARSCAW
jgi:hypothetical protein